MKMADLNDLLTHEMRDVHSAENQLLEALPQLADAASDPDLENAFRKHLDETRTHVERLSRAFSSIGADSDGEECEAMMGLIEEGEQVLESEASGEIRDAALIVAAQKVEHYEIASYGSLRSLADQLGLTELADLFNETLSEEAAANELLTKIATDSVNPKAMNS